MRGLFRGGLAAFGLLWIASSAALGDSSTLVAPGCGSEIRVLLYQSDAPFEIVDAGEVRRFVARSGGVEVDGSAVVPQWRRSGSGPAQLRGKKLTGPLKVIRTAGGLAVVTRVPLEEYVAGSLIGEIPASWAREALRAQAVVSRTYALHERAAHRRSEYDVEASTRSQVYVAATSTPDSIRDAVRDTGCQILRHAGKPILAAFHSASGGRTASSTEVWGQELRYLVSREVDEEEDSPDTYWRAGLSRTTLGRALARAGYEIGEVTQVEVLSRSASGRVKEVRLRGSRGKVSLTGRQLRSAVGESVLKSTLFELRESEHGFVFVGSGSGHGVGMSQWGAQGMAARGVGYREILKTFYPGTELERLRPSGRTRASDEPVAASHEEISGITVGTDIETEGRSMAKRSGAGR